MNYKNHLFYKKMNDIKYILFPGKVSQGYFSDAGLQEIYLKTYDLWKKVWLDTFKELNSHKKLSSDDFLRQDLIVCLMHSNEVIGVHLYNFFNIKNRAECEHSYFDTYPNDVMELLRQKNDTVVTMEYLTVHPEWRKSITGLPLGEIILGLATKVLNASNATAMIAPTRNNRKVNDMVYKFGGHCLAANLEKHNVDVDIVAYLKGQTNPHPSPDIQILIDTIWENRQNYFGNPLLDLHGVA